MRIATRVIGLVVLTLTLVAAPSARAQGYLCLEGGGSAANDDWAVPAFNWMLDRAGERLWP